MLYEGPGTPASRAAQWLFSTSRAAPIDSASSAIETCSANLAKAKLTLEDGSPDEALPFADRAYQETLQAFGSSSAALIPCHIILAQCYSRSKQGEKAINVYNQALALCRDSHEYVASKVTILGELASVYYSLGKKELCYQTYRERLRLLDDVSGPGSADNDEIRTLQVVTLKQLGALCLELEHLEDAEALFYRLAGLQHTDIEQGKTLSLLADLFHRIGRHDGALKIATTAQKILYHGDASHAEPMTLARTHTLVGRFCLEKRDLKAAEFHFGKAHNIYSRVRGPRDPQTCLLACDVAIVDFHLGRALPARAALVPNLKRLIKLLPQETSAALLLPYILTDAEISLTIAAAADQARRDVNKIREQTITEQALANSESWQKLGFIWQPIQEDIQRGVAKKDLSLPLIFTRDTNLKNARLRYVQALTYRGQLNIRPDHQLVTIYERLKEVCRLQGNSKGMQDYAERACRTKRTLDGFDDGNPE